MPTTEASRAASRRWKARNRERVRDARKRHYAENRERAHVVNRAWRKTHCSLGNDEAARKRRWRNSDSPAAKAEKARRGLSLNAESKAYLIILAGDPCAHCGEPATSIDHILPRSKGGPDDWQNFAGACVPCNSSKNATSLLLWLAHQ